MSVVLFDTAVTRLHRSMPIKDVPPLTGEVYRPNGNTALLDAVGQTIRLVEGEIAAKPADQRPNKVIAVIMTDGEENASREYGLTQIKQMIEERQASRWWEFIFLGANVDAFAQAGALGISSVNASNFAASSVGLRSAMCNTSARVGGFRKGFSAEDMGQFDASKGSDDEEQS